MPKLIDPTAVVAVHLEIKRLLGEGQEHVKAGRLKEARKALKEAEKLQRKLAAVTGR